jgi:hypothetical protein
VTPSTATARAVVTALLEAGVREVVVAPGSRNAPLSFALFDAARAGLLRLHTRIDERSAAFLALGLTKVGARAAVVCTSGTAVANLHPTLLEAAHEYLDPLVEAGVDTLVLGCTHYPLLTGVISYVMGDGVTLVSSAEECAKDVYKMLATTDLMREGGDPSYTFLTTGAPQEFESIGRRFLGPEMIAASQFAGGLVAGGLG